MMTDSLKSAAASPPLDFQSVHANYSRKLFLFIESRLRNHAVSEEIEQEVWIKVLENMDKIDDPKFSGWLFTVARSRITDYHRRYARQSNIEEPTVIVDVETGSEEHQKHLAAMRLCIEELPEPFKSTMKLLCAGLKQDEVAEKLQVKAGTVGSRRERKLNALNQCIQGKLEQSGQEKLS